MTATFSGSTAAVRSRKLTGVSSVRYTLVFDMELTPVDRKSTRLNSSHTVIYTLSLHDALPIYDRDFLGEHGRGAFEETHRRQLCAVHLGVRHGADAGRSEEHTSELQSHRDLHSFPTRRSSDL